MMHHTLLQRICWNSNGWRGPTGELLGKEASYVGTYGFGHEDWNFNINDRTGGSVFGYAYYRPNPNSAIFSERVDIHFFAIHPESRERLLVGHYTQARFLSKVQIERLKKAFVRSTLYRDRRDELLDLGLPKLAHKAAVHQRLVGDFFFNIEVDPANIIVLPSPVRLSRAMIGGGDPKQLNRYTKPKFLPFAPSTSGSPAKREDEEHDASDGDLLDDAYTRRTKAQLKVIKPIHRSLSNAFRTWLKNVGASGVKAERKGIDVQCMHRKQRYLFELKVCYQERTRHALREALGQLLEYAYYPGRAAPDQLAIVINVAPSAHDLRWFRLLNTMVTTIELYWLVGSTVHSKRITKQGLAKLAQT